MADHPPLPPTVDERIAHIADCMRRGAWVPYHTARELRDAWGLTLSTVRNYSQMAGKLVRAERPEREEHVDYASSCASEALDVAMKRMRGGGDVRDVTTALATYQRVHGIEPARKIETKDTTPPTGPRSKEALLELIGGGRPARTG